MVAAHLQLIRQQLTVDRFTTCTVRLQSCGWAPLRSQARDVEDITILRVWCNEMGMLEAPSGGRAEEGKSGQ